MPFPVSPNPGDSYTDAYGTVWIYAGAVNGWYRQTVIPGNETSYTADLITTDKIIDNTIINADVASNAAIAGTKISPNFGSQNVTTTGTSTAASFIPTSSTAPTNGVYLPAANSVAISSAGSGRVFINSSGRLGIGISDPSDVLHLNSGNARIGKWESGGSTVFVSAGIGSTPSPSYGSLSFMGYSPTASDVIKGRIRSADVSITNSNLGLLLFEVQTGAATITEAMRIDSNVYLRLSANSGGIQFNGDTAAANALDDYEEGTWTPSISFATPGDLSVTYTTQAGDYVKIGRLVTVRFSIQTSSFTHTTAANALRINGLPFTRQNLAPNFDGSALSQFKGITAAGYTQIGAQADGPGTSSLSIIKSGSGLNSATVVASDVPTGGTVILVGQYTYPA